MKNLSRRDMLKGALVATTTVGVGALALNQHADAGQVSADSQDAAAGGTYKYKNRQITLQPAAARITSEASIMSAVFIDGRALHVMRYPNGRFTSVMNHFQTFATLKETAEAAVVALNGANLEPMHHN